MKRLGYVSLALLCVLFLFCLSGCKLLPTKDEQPETGLNVYYVNPEQTSLAVYKYQPTGADTMEQINELLDYMKQTPDAISYRSALPQKLEIIDVQLQDGQLTLDFSDNYKEMTSVEEVLCRAAIVRTLVQINGVEGVSFYVSELPLSNGDGSLVGVMTEDSFVENSGDEINAIQTTSITLYFSSLDGQNLVTEKQKLHYSSNISLEKLIMERLIAGPTDSNAKSALPAGTTLVNVAVMDGVCFVNLNEKFLEMNFDVSPDVVIYSIVDSLQELPSIKKVQISVNGETNITYREKYFLNTMYERNLDLVVTPEQKIEGMVQPDSAESEGGEGQ